MRDDAYHLDGDTLGGLLTDIFGRDVTGREALCGTCGAPSAVGALIVCGPTHGSRLTCPGCGATLLVVMDKPGSYGVTFGKLRSLEIPLTA